MLLRSLRSNGLSVDGGVRMLLLLSVLMVTVPLHGIFWYGVHQERLHMRRYYKQALHALVVKGHRRGNR